MNRDLSRSAGSASLRAACWTASIVAGIGVALGAVEAREALLQQRYLELGFTRSTFLTIEHALRSGWDAALVPAGVLALVAALATWLAWRRNWRAEPEQVVALVGARSTPAWIASLAGVLVVLGLAQLDRQQGWVGELQFVYAAGVVVGSAVIVALLGAWARRASEVVAKARVVGATMGLAIAAVPIAWSLRAAPYRPFDTRAWAEVGVELAVMLVVAIATSVRARTRLEGRPSSRWVAPAPIAAALGVFAAALALGAPLLESSLGPPALVAHKPRNVLMIGIDTLRRDATSLDGLNARGRDTTPNLRRLAQRGFDFRHAESQAPWTLPAFASLLTGRYPFEHGTYLIRGKLEARQTTLAEVLLEAGYETIGVVSQFYLQRGSGFEQGCRRYDESAVTGERKPGAKLATDAAIRALDERSGAPFFEFVHYFDPHGDYLDHDEFHWADDYKGWLRGQMAFHNLLRSRHLFEKPELDFITDCYDEEVAYTDLHIGRLLDYLDQHDLWKDTLVLLVVDHGEQFLEHGSFGHTTALYDELVRVPMLVVPPGSTSATLVDTVVETRRSFDTVLDQLAIELHSREPRRSLLVDAEPSATAPHAFSVTWPMDADEGSGQRQFLSSVRTERWKLIHDWTRERRMLFDMSADPGQQHDVSAEHADVMAELGRELDEWTTKQRDLGGQAGTRRLDKDDENTLKSLGYLGDDR